MWVKDFMTTEVATITPDKTFKEALDLMVEKELNGLIVIDSQENKKPVGILTSKSIIEEMLPDYLETTPTTSIYEIEGSLEKFSQKAADSKVGDFMVKDFHTLSITDAMIEAAAFSARNDFRTIPVVDKEGKLAGVISRTDIKRAISKALSS